MPGLDMVVVRATHIQLRYVKLTWVRQQRSSILPDLVINKGQTLGYGHYSQQLLLAFHYFAQFRRVPVVVLAMVVGDEVFACRRSIQMWRYLLLMLLNLICGCHTNRSEGQWDWTEIRCISRSIGQYVYKDVDVPDDDDAAAAVVACEFIC